jgi:DNA polymerase-3 subunit delta
LKCEYTALSKYLEKSQNVYFIYGPEVVLRNHSKDEIKKSLANQGFIERRVITKEDFDKLHQIIIESSAGSLFGTKLIIDIHHDQGKLPDHIIKIFEIENISKNQNIALIINSHNEKLNSSTKWVKSMDKVALIVECKKLKSYEEKIWLKHQLDFVNEEDKKFLVQKIYEMNIGNLVAQQNEINVLKLLYKEDINLSSSMVNDNAEFEPFELEDALINLDTKHALRIASTIKESEAHYGPLLVWIIGKIVNNSTIAKQNNNPKASLEKSGIWSSKISNYMKFIKYHPINKLISLQKNVYELDMSSKGLGKKSFWDSLDRMIINLTTN